MWKLLGLMTLVMLAQVHAYDIVQSCRSSGCNQGCNHCETLEGGPFSAYTCIDPFTCRYKTQTLTITCNGCSNGVDCSYNVTNSVDFISGCTNDADFEWLYLKSVLDQDYQVLYPNGQPFDWCSKSCQNGLSTGVLIAIIAAGVVAVTVVVAIIVKLRKAKEAENYQKA